MSAPEEIAEIAADGVADAMHIVGEEALAAEEAVRGLQAMNLAYFGLGLVAGAAAGGFAAWRIAYRKAEVKYSQLAAEEISQMREHFNAKELARENVEEKGSLDAIVKERGYVPSDDDGEDDEPERSATPPMAVTPPSSVVERAEEVREEEAETPPSPAEDPEPVTRNVFREHADSSVEYEWDMHKERSLRSPFRPFVIHRDEKQGHEDQDTVTYTYYAEDDVVCNERDEVMTPEERERVIGEANLERFGHGSGDPNIVYVRNPELEFDMEVIRSPNSFAREVHGLEPDEPEIRHSDRRRGRRTLEDE